MKRRLSMILAFIIACALSAAAQAEGKNLLRNGEISGVFGAIPEEWRLDAWNQDDACTDAGIDPDGYEEACLRISNLRENDARFCQTVGVEPDTLYRFSGMVRAEGCDRESSGATLSIADIICYSDPVWETSGEWQRVELYGRTGPNQRELTVMVRVGAYYAPCQGTAWFDNLKLMQIDEAPEGVTVHSFYRDGGDQDDVPRYSLPLLAFISLCLPLAAGIVLCALLVKRPNWKRRFRLLLLFALIMRLVLAAFLRGHYGDMGFFIQWSEHIFEVGPRLYYKDFYCDYPPGYILLLWPAAALRRLLGLGTDSPVYYALLKLPPVLADIATAAVIWRVARKRLSDKAAAVVGLMYAFNPAVIADSAAWGQVDSTLTLMLALCALAAVSGKTLVALLGFGMALLLKPQALLFAPLGLIALFMVILHAEKGRRLGRFLGFIAGVVACLGLMYTCAYCFCGFGEGESAGLMYPFTWLIEQYSGAFNHYPNFTVNALNLYYLLRLNRVDLTANAVLALMAWGIYYASYAYCLVMMVVSGRRPRHLFLLAATLMTLIFAFGPMMHERYSFPVVMLLLIAFAYDRDWRVLLALFALTFALFLNETLVLQGYMGPKDHGNLQESERWLNSIVCYVNLFIPALLLWTSFDTCARRHMLPMPVEPSTSKAPGVAKSASSKVSATVDSPAEASEDRQSPLQIEEDDF